MEGSKSGPSKGNSKGGHGRGRGGSSNHQRSGEQGRKRKEMGRTEWRSVTGILEYRCFGLTNKSI
jgi:hypothetical protein